MTSTSFIFKNLALAGLLVGSQLALAETAPLQFNRMSETIFNGTNTVCALMSDTMDDEMPLAEINRYFAVEHLSAQSDKPQSAAVLNGQFCISGLSPGHSYRITLKKGLKSKNGSVMPEDITREIRLSDAKPEITSTSGNVLAKSLYKSNLQVKSINVSKLVAYLYRISRNDNSTSNIYQHLNEKLDTWEFYELISNHANLLGGKTYEIDEERNEVHYTNLNLTEFTDKREQGVYVLFVGDEKMEFNGKASDINDLEKNRTWMAKIIYVTDLGVTVYAGTENGISVSVHSLSDVGSIVGAKVRLIARNNTVLATSTTNSDGFASFPPKYSLNADASSVSGVEVDSGSDYMYTDLRGSTLYIEQDLSNTRPGYPEPPKGRDVFAYTDRGIYRPGETIHYMALVRDTYLNAVELPVLHLTVRRPDGMVYASYTLKNQGAGAFTHDFTAPPRGMQGNWNFELSEDQDAIYNSLDVEVQDFLPSHLHGSINTSNQNPLSTGDTANQFKVSASFNYGSPAVGTNASGSVVLAPDPHPLEQFKHYYFGPAEHEYEKFSFNHNFDNITLDSQGEGAFELKIPEATYARKLTLDVQFIDGTDSSNYLNSTYRVDSSAPLLGVRHLNASDGAGGLSVISVNARGEAVPQQVDYKLYRLHVDYQYVYKDNYWQYLRTERRILLTSGTVTADADEHAVRIPAPQEQGQYEVAVSDHKSTTTFEFYEGYCQSTQANTPDRIVLSHDKPSYKNGEPITLEFDSLYDGNSVLALGSQGIIKMSHYKIKKGHNVIRFTGDKTISKGAHVLLTTYAPLDDHPQVVRSVGLTYLTMDNEDKLLKVKLDVPARLKPAEALDVPLEVTGGDKEIYLTAALVDEGILSLTDFKSPRPEVEFFRAPQYKTNVYDMYGYLMRQVMHQDHGHGGMDSLSDLSAGSLASLSRRNLAFFSGIVKVQDGKAKLHFDLPKHQGSLRLMVVAYDQHKIGSASSTILVKDRATVLADIPYVMHLEDSIDSALRINNLELEAAKFSFKVNCEGSLKCSLPDQNVQQELEVKKSDLKPIPLKLTAAALGSGKLSYEVRNGDFVYQDELNVEIAPQVAEIFTQKAYFVEPHQELRIKPQQDYLPDALISVSKGALPYVDTALFKEELYNTDTPYTFNIISAIDGCLHADYIDKKELSHQIKPNSGKLQELIYALVGRISDNGSVATIERNYSYDPFATVQAFKVLYLARQAGFDVPSSIISSMLTRVDALSRDLSNPVICAYALEAMTLYGEVTLATLRYQFDTLKTRSPLANIGYARAFRLNGDRERMTLALQAALSGMGEFIEIKEKLSKVVNPEEQLKQIIKMQELENVSLSSIPYDLAELLDAALYCQNSEIFTKAVSLVLEQDCYQNYVSKPVMASLLRCAVNLDVGEQKFVSDKEEVVLKNDTDKNVGYTVGILGYPKQEPDTPEGSTLSVAFFLPDGTPLRAPYEFRQNEFVTAVYTLKQINILDDISYVRGMLPTGFTLEKVIYTEDQSLNHYGSLQALEHLHRADLGFVGELMANNRQGVKFALLLRPTLKGQVILPALRIFDSHDPDQSVYTKPQVLTVK
ncbi:MAG: hypothetical protein K6F05_04255 [Succinivibrio sp.]|nr:hypothetical protein [Succinivibrio sp.]